MGEIGGNDYNYRAFVGGSINQLRASVPLVVKAITKATRVCYANLQSLLEPFLNTQEISKLKKRSFLSYYKPLN